MAMIGGLRIGLKDTSQSCTVPDAPKARLMYYLNCICTSLEIDDNAQLRRLKDFANYGRLSDDETDKLVLMCFLVSPDEILNKCIFMDEDMCGDSGNKFFELSAVHHHLLVAESIIIGGQRKQVKKIMTFKRNWIDRNYFEPMRHFDGRLRRVLGVRQRQQEEGCFIL